MIHPLVARIGELTRQMAQALEKEDIEQLIQLLDQRQQSMEEYEQYRNSPQWHPPREEERQLYQDILRMDADNRRALQSMLTAHKEKQTQWRKIRQATHYYLGGENWADTSAFFNKKS